MKAIGTLGDGLSVAVFGASGGIGRAFVNTLAKDNSVEHVLAFSRRPVEELAPSATAHHIDILDEQSVERAASVVSQNGPLHLAIVATGLLHAPDVQPEKRARELSASSMEQLFRTNAMGPALVAKHVLPLLDKDRKSVFAALSARVGSIEDNKLGGWHSYRASKAALNMMLRTLSIELSYRNSNAICVALHPGTVATRLSEPFQRNVAKDKLFKPEYAVAQMLTVIDGLTVADTGEFLGWNGEKLPY